MVWHIYRRLALFAAAMTCVKPSGGEMKDLTMLWKGAGRTTATFEGNTLALNNEGILFAYRK